MLSPDVHTPFRFGSLEELRDAIAALNLRIPTEEDTSYLLRQVRVGDKVIPNAMATQPMEGCDGTLEGAPGELTFRRYRRFGAGGAGLIWFEACAVVPEGRANPRQIWLHGNTRDEFSRLLEQTLSSAEESMSKGFRPCTVIQLTHSGRYSRPVDAAKPVIAYHDPILDKTRGIPEDYPLITDEELERLEDAFVAAAKLAYEVGFDAVDVKSCHRYLLNELLAAHTRDGKYGGSYENRTRFIKNVIGKVRAEVGSDKIITTRINIHDAHPYPFGWGMDPNDPTMPNMEEPKRLAKELQELGVPLINMTMGNPYFNPHINRPFDRPIEGLNCPQENPLVSENRLMSLTDQVRKHVPEVVVIGSGFSWLRNLWPHVGAGCIREGSVDIIGLGRQAFAYPGFAREIVETGKLDKRHICIGCSSCSQIMRDGGMSGCVPFDGEIYGPIYRDGRSKAKMGNSH